MQIEEYFIDIVVNNDFDNFLYLIENNKVDPSYDNNLALVISTEENKVEFVEYLLGLNLEFNSYIQKFLFQQAIEYNSKDVLPLLIEDHRLSVTVEDNFPLKFSLKHKNIPFIKKILEEEDVLNTINIEWINKKITNKEEKEQLLLFYKILDF